MPEVRGILGAMQDSNSDSRTLGPREVAALFGVTVPTVRAWDKAGKIPPSFRTPGNQRRWHAPDIEAVRERVS